MTRSDKGFATAEAAVVLPTLMVVLSLCVGVVVAVGAQLRCVDAARVAARVAARGDTDAQARAAGRQAAPGGAEVRVSHTGPTVQVLVEVDLRVTRWLPALHLAAASTAEVESP